jgi:hypothetical protein
MDSKTVQLLRVANRKDIYRWPNFSQSASCPVEIAVQFLYGILSEFSNLFKNSIETAGKKSFLDNSFPRLVWGFWSCELLQFIVLPLELGAFSGRRISLPFFISFGPTPFRSYFPKDG